MRLTTTREIAAPPEAVFAELADYDRYEAEAERMRVRLQPLPRTGPRDAAWDLTFDWRGPRRVRVWISDYHPSERLAADAKADGVGARATFCVAAAGSGRSRLDADLDITATSLGGKILLQSLRLIRGSLEARLGARIDRIAERAEQRST